MLYKQRSNLSMLLALVVLLFTRCNNESQRQDNDNSDSASTDIVRTNFAPLFDTSHSVTAISPNLYKPLADTLNIRILQGTYKPGDSSIMHAHPDFALYVLEGGTVELTGENGDKQNVEFRKNMAVVLPAATHSAKNIGKTTLKLIVVEVNRPRN